MKAELCVTLVNYRKPKGEEDGSELYVELIKEIEIEIVPSRGLNLRLSPITSKHPNSEKYRKVLEDTEELVSGIFEVDSTFYDVDSHKLTIYAYLGCYDSYISAKDFQNVIDQLVLGYEFTVDD